MDAKAMYGSWSADKQPLQAWQELSAHGPSASSSSISSVSRIVGWILLRILLRQPSSTSPSSWSDSGIDPLVTDELVSQQHAWLLLSRNTTSSMVRTPVKRLRKQGNGKFRRWWIPENKSPTPVTPV
ncbi:hypothetical protein Tco_0955785 [Tanacetum coccineum]|uniref:Uncharacterized protein n=1 Tax=Tanacetum coccineum TaxID=301880 RepID=A0ABQ5E864_9ASTR